jgi:enterochelin esterase-like enzyme
MLWMPGGLRTSRAQVWADNLGDWTWPGQAGAAAVEALPPAWVPAFPSRSEPAALPAGRTRAERARRLLIAVLLSALAAVAVALVLQGHPVKRVPASPHHAAAPVAAIDALHNLPTLKSISVDHTGSAIKKASYTSVALRGGGSFYVYLPPGYSPSTTRYPVLYLLHGNSQPATAFLHIGLQGTLDRLIGEHLIGPVIAVMIEGSMGSDNWRNLHGLNYESYVLEAQEMVDRMLPTIAGRAGRAIAGDSMGGYGAMNLALGNPARFGVVESWIGFFNGLEGQLQIDKPIIAHSGLHAFIYGAAQDTIADPSENAPFAADLRAAGADAQSAVYPGEHSLETVESHLASMLHFAGRWLASATHGHGAH